MLRDVAFIAIGCVLVCLIMLKSDKQSGHMLEGRLHRLGADTSLLPDAWRKRKRGAQYALAAIGGGFGCLAIILATRGNAFFLAAALGALICAGAGMWGSIGALMSAYREIDAKFGPVENKPSVQGGVSE